MHAVIIVGCVPSSCFRLHLLSNVASRSIIPLRRQCRVTTRHKDLSKDRPIINLNHFPPLPTITFPSSTTAFNHVSLLLTSPWGAPRQPRICYCLYISYAIDQDGEPYRSEQTPECCIRIRIENPSSLVIVVVGHDLGIFPSRLGGRTCGRGRFGGTHCCQGSQVMVQED